MCLSMPFRHVLKSSRWRVKGGAQLIAPMCTCSESFASPSKNAVSLILQFLASKCSGRYGGPHLPRQNLLFHGKTYFFTAKLTFPRQNLLSHGKTYFSTAKLTFCLKYGIWKGNLETESGNGIRNPESGIQ